MESVAQENSAGLVDKTGRHRVELQPTTQPAGVRKPLTLDLSGWTYRAVKSPNPRDGVPWELIATPTEKIPEGWQKGRASEGANLMLGRRFKGDIVVQPGPINSPIPIVEVPEILWRQWLAPNMQDVVGIHFHEAVTKDVARILFTLHKIPPDEPSDGATARDRLATSKPSEARGTRIEATLLTPVAYCLDQSIVVRQDAKKKMAAARRGQHELGHAGVSQSVFFAALAGPQDWNPLYNTGRRSRIEYYWKRERLGRTWDDFRTGKGELTGTRTIVVLVPPTRWSIMLPIPPERVTQKQIDEFNDAIVGVSRTFNALDAAEQERFHATHGAYEEAAGP
ncbi:MAG: hypothetical protein AABZ08_07840 [Planctomycetota bacterium]